MTSEPLNCLGMKCPRPIVEMAKRIRRMEDGEIMEVHADDPVAEVDIPAWCETTGNTFLKMEKADGFMRYFIQKSPKS
jgi:TusA-related sulfurtransferase